MRKHVTALAVLGISALLLSACSSGHASPAPAADAPEERGPITLAVGAVSGGPAAESAVDAWNAEHPDEKVTLLVLSGKSDAQRQQMFQNAQTKSDAFTVMALDGPLIAQFAANRWIDPLPEDQLDLEPFLPSTIEQSRYRDTLYALPLSTDAGMLYYRTDLLTAAGITEVPKTFDEIAEACAAVKAIPEGAGVNCYAGQFDKYEGLTVNFAEIITTAGGSLLDADGKPTVDTPEATKGLELLTSWFEDGTIPSEAITYNEEAGRQSFLAGNLLFHRQWAYQYASASAADGSSAVAGKFDVAPLPGFTASEPGRSVLGGKNLVISSFAKNKTTAIDFIKWFDTREHQVEFLSLAGIAPTISDVYDDPKMLEKYPYLTTLKDSVLGGFARPAVPNYDDVTAAIQTDAYAALKGEKTPAAALADMQNALTGLLSK